MTSSRPIQELSCSVKSKLRSGISITSIGQCIEELVLNAVDSGATNIAVRVDMNIFRIQVVDNGEGISESNLKVIGSRYATSKCHSLQDLRSNLTKYGFRGEALASIIQLSGIVDIVSRYKDCIHTYAKLFTYSKAKELTHCDVQRPSCGTTVTIQDFMYNMPVRKKLIREAIDIENIKHQLERIALILPHVSVILRNDRNKQNVLQLKKRRSIIERFLEMFGKDHERNMAEIHHSVGHFEIDGYISTQPYQSKSLQFIYVNRRSVIHTKLHSLMNDLLGRSSIINNKTLPDLPPFGSGKVPSSPPKGIRFYGIFMLNVTCPRSEYEICLEPKKTLVEFRDWEKVLLCIEEMVLKFIKEEELTIALDDRFRRSEKETFLSVYESPFPHCSDDKLQVFSNPKLNQGNVNEKSNVENDISLSNVRAAVQGISVRRLKQTTNGILSCKSDKPNRGEEKEMENDKLTNTRVGDSHIQESFISSSLKDLSKVAFLKKKDSSSVRCSILPEQCKLTNGKTGEEELCKLQTVKLKNKSSDDTFKDNKLSLSSLEALKLAYEESIKEIESVPRVTPTDKTLLDSQINPLTDKVKKTDKIFERCTNTQKRIASKKKRNPVKKLSLSRNLGQRYKQTLKHRRVLKSLNSFQFEKSNEEPKIKESFKTTQEKSENFHFRPILYSSKTNLEPCSDTQNTLNSSPVEETSLHNQNGLAIGGGCPQFQNPNHHQNKGEMPANSELQASPQCFVTNTPEPVSVLLPFPREVLKDTSVNSYTATNNNEGKISNIDNVINNTSGNSTTVPTASVATNLEECLFNFDAPQNHNLNNTSISAEQTPGSNFQDDLVQFPIIGLEKIVTDIQKLNDIPDTQPFEVDHTQTMAYNKNFEDSHSSPHLSPAEVCLMQEDSANFGNLKENINQSPMNAQAVTDMLTLNDTRLLETQSFEINATQTMSYNTKNSHFSPHLSLTEPYFMQGYSAELENDVRAQNTYAQQPENSDKQINTMHQCEPTDKQNNDIQQCEPLNEQSNGMQQPENENPKDPEESDGWELPLESLQMNFESLPNTESSECISSGFCKVLNDFISSDPSIKLSSCSSTIRQNMDEAIKNLSKSNQVTYEGKVLHIPLDSQGEETALKNKLSESSCSARLESDTVSNNELNTVTNTNTKLMQTTDVSEAQWKAASTADGKNIYINLRTGNTSFVPPSKDTAPTWNASQAMGSAPLTIPITDELYPLGTYKKRHSVGQNFTLSHGFQPFLPSKRKLKILNSKSLNKIKKTESKYNKVCSDHFQETLHESKRFSEKNRSVSQSQYYVNDPKTHQDDSITTDTNQTLHTFSGSLENNDEPLISSSKEEIAITHPKNRQNDMALEFQADLALDQFVKTNTGILEEECSKWKDDELKHQDNLGTEKLSVVTVSSLWETKDSYAMDADVLCFRPDTMDQHNTASSVNSYNVIHPYKFTREMLKESKVFGQVDKKFIALSLPIKESWPHLIVLVDQHAADERVQLERLLEQSFELKQDADGWVRKVIKSACITPPIQICFTPDRLRLMKNFRNAFSDIGMEFTVMNESSALFHRLPCCLVGQDQNEKQTRRCQAATLIVEAAVVEICDNICILGGSATHRVADADETPSLPLPRPLSHVVNTIACRNAIKFGENLSVEQCQSMIESLSSCRLPFQCAHGRPSLVPIVDLHFVKPKNNISKPNIRKLWKKINLK